MASLTRVVRGGGETVAGCSVVSMFVHFCAVTHDDSWFETKTSTARRGMRPLWLATDSVLRDHALNGVSNWGEEDFTIAVSLDVCACQSIAARAFEYWFSCFERVRDEAMEIGDLS